MNGIITCAINDCVGSWLLVLKMGTLFLLFDIDIFVCLILKPSPDQVTSLLNTVSDTVAQQIHFKI